MPPTNPMPYHSMPDPDPKPKPKNPKAGTEKHNQTSLRKSAPLHYAHIRVRDACHAMNASIHPYASIQTNKQCFISQHLLPWHAQLTRDNPETGKTTPKMIERTKVAEKL
jgi:hypothetical protein